MLKFRSTFNRQLLLALFPTMVQTGNEQFYVVPECAAMVRPAARRLGDPDRWPIRHIRPSWRQLE
jgi:hypothetical protein